MDKVVWLVLVAVASGCVAPAEGPPVEPAQLPGSPTAFTWNNCQGFLATQSFAAGLNPGDPPGDWEDAGEAPTRVGVYGWECARVHWDHLERGPVRFLLEVHDDMAVPASCRAGAEQSHWVLASFWTDNDGVAEVASRAMGILAHAGPITRQDDGTRETWSWGGSRVTFLPGGGEEVVLPAARFFWEADGIQALDLLADARGGPLNGVATGTFAPPMLLAGDPQPRPLASSGYTRTTLTGDLEAPCA